MTVSAELEDLKASVISVTYKSKETLNKCILNADPTGVQDRPPDFRDGLLPRRRHSGPNFRFSKGDFPFYRTADAILPSGVNNPLRVNTRLAKPNSVKSCLVFLSNPRYRVLR